MKIHPAEQSDNEVEDGTEITEHTNDGNYKLEEQNPFKNM